MKRTWRLLATVGVLFGLLPLCLAAKPADPFFGLTRGNKTYEVPADTWVGMYVLNTAGTGHITEIQLLVDDDAPTGLVRMAIYYATPCTLYQDLSFATVVDGWVTISGLNIPVTAGSYYHLAFDLENPTGIRADRKTDLSSYSAPWPYDADPFGRPESATDMPPGGQTSAVQYVIRAIVAPD
ncbi:MAG: hypothetical protein Q7R50_00170 [Dehalococcoidales bacterium]|nr:hypothetical protein [Dehalococcoidales bacterium]